MIIDIEKLKGITNIIFPSKNKCNRFVQCLRLVHGYTIIGNASVIQNTGGYLKVDYLKKEVSYAESTADVVLADSTYKPYTDFIVPAEEVLQGHTHYLTIPIVGSDGDLELRYYIQFNDRPDYVGKYFIKEKSTKNYLGISKEQAGFVKSKMTKDSWMRVIGFKSKREFKRVRLTLDGKPWGEPKKCAKHPSEDLVRGQEIKAKIHDVWCSVVFSHSIGTRVFVFIDNTSRFISNTVEVQSWNLKD